MAACIQVQRQETNGVVDEAGALQMLDQRIVRSTLVMDRGDAAGAARTKQMQASAPLERTLRVWNQDGARVDVCENGRTMGDEQPSGDG